MRLTLLLSFLAISFTDIIAQNYFLNGNAIAVGDDCYQLTASVGTQNGTVWYGEQIDLEEPFDLQFIMNLGSLDNNGADGICFVLQTVGTGAIGESGGGMGYLNFGTSFGIEFDTWQNGEFGDPWYDHIAMEYNGDINHNTALGNVSGPVQMDNIDPNTEDGQNHTVQITWDPSSQTCEVYFDCTFRLAGKIDLINTVFGGQNLVYFGFTAATGGSWNTQVMCLQENIIAVGPEVTICTGASATLSVAGNAQGTYEWTPSDYLDDPTSSTPEATPPVTTTYTVTFSDLCGNTLSENITVFVEDLEVEIPDDYELTCANGNLQIDSETNFINNIEYTWETDDGEIEGDTDDSSVNVTAPGTYTLTATYQDLCTATTSITVTSDFSDFEVNTSVSNILSCIDSTATIVCTTNQNNAVTYTWTTVEGNILSGTNQSSVLVNGPGLYFAQAYLNEYCNDGVQVEVFANFDVYITDAGPDMELNCYSDEIELDGNTNSINPEVLWITNNGNIVSGATTLTPLIDEAGTYTLTSTHLISGCTAQDEVIVTENFTEPSITILSPDTLTCVRPVVVIDEFEIEPEGGSFNFEWSTQNGVIVTYSEQTGMASVNAAGTYSVIVMNEDNGCSAMASTEVMISENFEMDLSQLRFPNIITDDGDAKNERWIPFLSNAPDVYVPELFDSYEIKIFNRWGKLIFENTDNLEFWTPGDEKPGTYYYTLEYSTLCGNGQSGKIEGYIELVRP